MPDWHYQPEQKPKGKTMTKMTKAQQAQTDRAREELRMILSPGDTVNVIQRHVSRSGMLRHLSLFVGDRNITALVADALGEKLADHHGQRTLKVHGCGMDMHFHTVYSLGSVLWPDGVPCIGAKKCRSNDHSNDYGTWSREYDATHAGQDESREEYAAAKQDWIATQRAKSYRKSRTHGDGGYALNYRTL